MTLHIAPDAGSFAVRTVGETDDVRLIEGLAYPFGSRDTYNTFFSARTDFHWDMFRDTDPATRSAGTPGFVRPLTFQHGFDPTFGLARIGGWSPIRIDSRGIWITAGVYKNGPHYATRIKPLLDAGTVGLSGGSAEHSVRIDQRSGAVLDWPAYELALTTVESNLNAAITMRADLRLIPDQTEAMTELRLLGVRAAQQAANDAVRRLTR